MRVLLEKLKSPHFFFWGVRIRLKNLFYNFLIRVLTSQYDYDILISNDDINRHNYREFEINESLKWRFYQ